MSRAPSIRRLLWVVVLIWSGTSGCIHNHYYGTMPGYPPGSVPITTQIGGSVCDVPSTSSGGVIVSSTTPSRGGISSNVVMTPPAANEPAITAANAQPRILISRPAYPTSPSGTTINWSKWRRTDPESVANVRTEGALDDGTVNR